MNATRARPHHTFLSRLAFVAATLSLIAACAPAGGDLGSAATPIPTPAASVDAPSPEPTAGQPTGTPPTPGTPSPAASGATATASPSPAGTTTIRAYFMLGSFTDNAGLAPVLREIPRTQAVATAAMTALLAGPSGAETTARPAMYSAIAGGTRLLSLSITNGTAAVDLSQEFDSFGTLDATRQRLAQVVFTLTQFTSVDAVRISVEGAPLAAYGTLSRASFSSGANEAVLPAIFVDRPAWGAAIGNPARVTGNANVFEAAFRVAIVDASGKVIADQGVMASCGTGCRGTFDATIAYSVAKAGWGTLRVYDPSAKDGSAQDVTEYPVWLTPVR